MDDTLKLILEVLDTKEPKFLGINFFLNFLKDTCDERIVDGKRVKFPIFHMFRNNVLRAPKMLNTQETWDRISKTGDVSNAFVTAFDWDKTPEGYMFWDKFNDLFKKQYNEAKIRGLRYGDAMPKIITPNSQQPIKDIPCTDKHPKAEEIRIMPSEVTLKLLRYLSPLCEHCTNKQIDILIDILKTNKCQDEFFTNLRVKPKHKGYEDAFNKFLSGGDLRSVIYWAFNWASVSEGFSFWSQMSDKLNAAITKEIVANAHPISEFINPNIDRTPNGSPIMRVDPITHATNAMTQGNQTRPTTPQYRPPLAYMSQDHRAEPPHTTGPFRPHVRTAYDDMCGGGYWDGWYEDDYDYWDAYYRSSYKSSIPKEIIQMATNKNYICIASKVKEPVTA